MHILTGFRGAPRGPRSKKNQSRGTGLVSAKTNSMNTGENNNEGTPGGAVAEETATKETAETTEKLEAKTSSESNGTVAQDKKRRR